jgi:hypothetical protein
MVKMESNIPITFTSFGYCYLGDKFQLSFQVEENQTVKYYIIDGSIDNQKYSKISEVISEKTKGSKTYDVIMSKKRPPYYFQVHAVYENKLIDSSPILSIE